MPDTEFINTITPETDDALLNKFLRRNITEYKDNIIKSIGAYAFYFCGDIKLIDLPNLITSGNYSFGNCYSLEKVNLPQLTNVGENGFEYATLLTSINLPNVKSIGYNAFTYSNILRRVDLIVCNTISPNAFKNCSSLEELIIRRSDKICTLINTSAFIDTKIVNGEGYIYVPQELIEQYKEASNWKTLANQFRAIEDYPEICDIETE